MEPRFDSARSHRFGSIGAHLDGLCDEFEAAWQQGAAPQIEAFLSRAPPELRQRLLLELLYLDVAYRRARGEQPKPADYAGRFPKLHELIAQALAVPSDSDPWPVKRRWLQSNLLFGLLAHQNGLLTREQLLKAIQQWKQDKRQSLANVLQAQHALGAELLAALQVLVTAYQRRHQDDPQQGLASLSSLGSLRKELEQLADAEIDATLAFMAKRSAAEPVSEAAPPNGAKPRFRILKSHARGGLGEVFVAHDTELNRRVALKEIQVRHAKNPDARARFLQEAKITGNLEHPGIVPVYALGIDADGRPYYAMRFVQGDTLKGAIDEFHTADKNSARDTSERAIALRKLLQRFIDVCNAIEYAHSRGVLHRDLKPGNILIGKYGETLVVDWGLAKMMAKKEPAVAPSMSNPHLSSTLDRGSTPTAMGTVLGTPQFMSPEQASGELDELGPATDVYSLGATLYMLLTGIAPLVGDDLRDLLRRVQQGQIRRPRQVRRDVPPALEAICLKAMNLSPNRRYPSARALADDLERWLADERVAVYREPLNERFGRWSRKHRTAVTGAGALLTTAIVALTIGLFIVSAEQLRTEEQRKLAEQKQGEADEQRRLADQRQRETEAARANEALQRRRAEEQRRLADEQKNRAEQEAYLARIQAADASWKANDTGAAMQYLDACQSNLRGWEFDYLYTKFNRGQRTLRGHHSIVLSVAFSPDGTRIASGSVDNTVIIWNAATGRVITTLHGHTHGVTGVAYSPDGKRLASASLDSTVILWNAETGEATFTLSGHASHVWSVAFSPDGKRIVSGSDSADKTLKIWNAETGQEELTILGHSGNVRAVAFSPDGHRIASGEGNGAVGIWDAETGGEILSIAAHAAAVESVSFSPDGKRIASGSRDRTVKVWNAGTGRESLTLRGHSEDVTSVAFSPDGKRIASGSYDRTIKVWNAETGEGTLTFRGHSLWVHSVAFSPNGKRIASGSRDGTVKVWDAESGQETLTLRGHTEDVNSVAFSPDGKRIVSGTWNDTIKVWNAQSGQAMFSIRPPRVTSGTPLSHDGKRIVSGNVDGTVRVWNAETGEDILTLRGHTKSVRHVAISPDGKRIVSASDDKTVKVWNAETGEELFTLHECIVCSVAFSPDGRRIAGGIDNTTVSVWNAESGRESLTLRGHHGVVVSVAFSPDGKRIASGSVDDTVKVWNAQTGQEIFTLRGHSDSVWSVAFSPDEKRIVSGSFDGTIKVWDAETGQETLTLRGHSGRVNCVAFSPDGKRIASGSHDTMVKVWDAASRRDDAAKPTGFATPTPTTTAPLAPENVSRGTVRFVGEWTNKDFKTPNVTRVHIRRDGERFVAHIWGRCHPTECDWGETTATANGEVLSLMWNPGFKVETQRLRLQADGTLRLTGHCHFTDGSGRKDYDSEEIFVKGLVHDWSDGQAGNAEKMVGQMRHLEGHVIFPVSHLCFSPDGGRLVSAPYLADYNGSVDAVRVWDVDGCKEVAQIKIGNEGNIHKAVVSPDGGSILVASNRSLCLFELETGRRVRPFVGHEGWVCGAAFSSDGKQVASCAQDHTIKLWDVATGHELRHFSGHTDVVCDVAFSPTGRQILSASNDSTVRLWAADTGAQLRCLTDHAERVAAVAFSPDGRYALSGGGNTRLGSGGKDFTLRLWDIERRTLIRRLKGHTSGVGKICFAPNGQRALSSGPDGIILWNLATGDQLLTLRGGNGGVAFAPDGRSIAYSSQLEPTIFLRRLSAEEAGEAQN